MNVDVAIFITFLVLNLVVGLRYGKGVTNIKDYALGGRNFSTGALVSTIVATWVGGGFFFTTLSKTYSDGLYYVIASSAMSISFIILAFVFIPKMNSFLGNISIAEALGNLYGKYVRIITAIAGIIAAVGYVAVQFKAFGNIFNYFLGIPSNYAVILSGIVVTVYSAFGGIRAVTFTDVLQFATFGIAIPLVGILIWNQIYFFDNFDISRTLADPKFDITQVLNFGNPKLWEMMPLLFYFVLPGLDPSLCQRILIGSNIQQVKKAFMISALLIVVLKLTVAWIPFLIYTVNPGIESGKLLSYIIDNYTHAGLKGLIIIGIASMAMSTADSDINSSSVLFANDFCIPLNIDKNNTLLISKIFAFVLGILAAILALSLQDLLSIVLSAASFYIPIVTIPLMLTILGFRTTTKSVLIGMFTGFVTVLVWKILAIKADCIIFAMLANLIFMMSSHYLLKQPGGWIKIEKTQDQILAQAERKRKFAKLTYIVKNFNFLEFCKRTAPKNELMYMGLGIYFIFYALTTMYLTHVQLLSSHGKIILTIYQIMVCTGTTLAAYPIWPPRIKKEIVVQVAWNIVIFYMLIFFSCFFTMVSNFSQLQFAIFTLNIVATAVLVGWKRGLAMMAVGFYLSAQFYKYYAGVDNLDLSIGSPQSVIMYVSMLAAICLIIFLKPKQEQLDLTEQRADHLSDRILTQEEQVHKALGIKEEFLRNIQHEYHTPMTGVISLSQALFVSHTKMTPEKISGYLESIYKSALRIDSYDNNINMLSKLSKTDYNLNLEQINLSDLLYERIEICRNLYEQNKVDREFIFNIENDITANIDKQYFIKLLDNLIVNAISYCKQGKITTTLKRTNNNKNISLTIEDEGIGIPEADKEYIFGNFTVSSKTWTPAGGRGVGLALCKRVIEVHGGKITAESNSIKGATFKVTLPQT